MFRSGLTLLLLAMAFLAKAQYQINGAASQISCNCFELNPDQPFLGGSVWNVNQISLSNPFNFNFQVWLGCDEWGADGMAFVLQPVNVNQGGSASSLGYGGIVPSLVVELDTWPNDVTMSDPQADHIAILMNGSADHASANNLAGPVQASATSNNIENCAWHTVQFIWDPGLNTLAVFFDGSYRTSYTGNIVNTIFGGNNMVYWGWTSGTGSAASEFRFCNSILPDYDITNMTTCAGTPIQFVSTSLTATNNISSFSWNFGDGSTGSGAPVSHTYAAGGTYNVTLAIVTEGCSADTVIPITIDPIPNVNLGADVGVCDGGSVQLNSPNTLGTGTYAWSPTTGLSSSSAQSPTATPTATTNYTLTFTSTDGCSNSDQIQVAVNPLPTASAGVDATVCENDGHVLQATGGTSYAWTPAGSLSNANVANPTATPSVTTTYTVTATDANGCTDTDDVTITIVPAPTLDAGQDANICEGDVVQLNALGTGAFAWTPALGLSSTSIADPTATPTITTVYYVTLTDANSCTSTDSVIVDVDPIPVADFPDPTAVCDGSPVQFNDNSTGTITDYIWDFGDGQGGTGPNPTHIYPSVGVYTVNLTTISANGCSASTSGLAEVITGPIADFTLPDGPDFCVNDLLAPVNNSSGPIATYTWDFGEGTNSNMFEPNFAYSTEGAFTVTLTVATADNCANTYQRDVVVNPIPQVDFSASPACFGEGTQFTDLSSVTTGTINGWEWDFGDGSNVNYSQNAAHTYNSYGGFTVQLIGLTAVGCRDTVMHAVYVNPTPEVTISAESVCEGLPSSFVNSTVPNDGTIANWAWDFGDGQVGVGAQVAHQYASYGAYIVNLVAVTDGGCVGTGSTTTEVYPFPIAAMSYSNNEGCTPVPIDFTDMSSIAQGYSISDVHWYFGDGGDSQLSDPSYIYQTPGIYDVSLVVTAADGGCTDTIVAPQAMSIYVTPVADFEYQPTNATMLDPRIYFTNTTINGIDYIWEFGDDSGSTMANPMNTYLAEGDYTVVLTATNGICSSTTQRRLKIEPETFIYVPNSFTPNSDGVNEGFIAQGIGIVTFDMAIFDRWGTELYFTSDLNSPWDGTFKGKQCPIDTYVYLIHYLDVKGNGKQLKGHVNLVR